MERVIAVVVSSAKNNPQRKHYGILHLLFHPEGRNTNGFSNVMSVCDPYGSFDPSVVSGFMSHLAVDKFGFDQPHHVSYSSKKTSTFLDKVVPRRNEHSNGDTVMLHLRLTGRKNDKKGLGRECAPLTAEGVIKLLIDIGVVNEGFDAKIESSSPRERVIIILACLLNLGHQNGMFGNQCGDNLKYTRAFLASEMEKDMDNASVRGEVMHPYSVVGLSKQLMEKIATEKKLPGDSKCICDRM